MDAYLSQNLNSNIPFLFQGAKLPAENLITKSLDNIVGNLWQQARQDSSGSSAGNQVRIKYTHEQNFDIFFDIYIG